MPENHSFVSITVIRVDARITLDGGVEYAEAPDRQPDQTPEQVCEICWVPLSPISLQLGCPGPKIPDTIDELPPPRENIA